MQLPVQVQQSARAITGIYEKMRYSKRFFHYLGALVLGLGLAKAVDASLLYYLGSKRPAKNLQKNSRRVDNSRQLNDSGLILSNIIGGAFFADALPEPQTQEFAIGAKVGIARILSVGNGYIWFRQSGKKYKLENGESTAQLFKELSEAAAAKPTAEATDETPAAGQTLTKVLSRQRVNSMVLGNVAKIYQGASFGPKLENGKIVGYKIHKVNQGHIFYELGARSGDIIRKINGFELSDTERMFELWRSMKTTPRIKIEIERNSKLFTYDFHIRN